MTNSTLKAHLVLLLLIFCLQPISTTSAIKDDYYKILSIPKTATTKEIKKAFRQKAIIYHPDKNEGSQKQWA